MRTLLPLLPPRLLENVLTVICKVATKGSARNPQNQFNVLQYTRVQIVVCKDIKRINAPSLQILEFCLNLLKETEI